MVKANQMINLYLGHPIATTEGPLWSVHIEATINRRLSQIWGRRHSGTWWRQVPRTVLAWRLRRDVKVRKSQLLIIPFVFHPIPYDFMKLYLTF